MQPLRINFLELNSIAKADAIRQMVEIHKQEPIYEVSTAEEFASMIAGGYNPDKDFEFLQYPNDNADNVTVYSKDFS